MCCSGASRLAAHHDIRVVGRWDMLRLAVRTQHATADNAWNYVSQLRDAGCHPSADIATRDGFDRWLA